MLPSENRMKQDIIQTVKDLMANYNTVRDAVNLPLHVDSELVKRTKTDAVNMSDGSIKVNLDVDEAYYYEMLTEMIGEDIKDEYQLLGKLKEFSHMKREYAKVLNAVNLVRMKGYGVVTPEKSEIVLNTPELIKHGNKFGVKIKATSPSIHMIRANIETEIAPIVGTEDQAEDLIHYINNADTCEDGIWETNIFGKTVEQLVNDGITGKIASIGDDSQLKLQDTMQKIVNDSNGGMVCIII
jgi:stage IV sporulation protein A